MRYASIDECECCNGTGWGVSFYTQYCPFHCKGCFNPETHSKDGGFEYTEETKNKILSLIERKQIKRFSILGGEPFTDEKILPLIDLIVSIKKQRPDISIWIYSGRTYEELLNVRHLFKLLLYCNVLVDGKFIEELKDERLAFRGSSNQRILVKKSDKWEEINL